MGRFYMVALLENKPKEIEQILKTISLKGKSEHGQYRYDIRQINQVVLFSHSYR